MKLITWFMFHYIRLRQVQQKTGQNLGGLHIHNRNPPILSVLGVDS